MPIICRLPGGSKGSGDGGSSDLQLNIFTQPEEPETKDGIWVQRSNTHKKIAVDNLVSASGEWSDMSTAPFSFDNTNRPVLYGTNIVTMDSNLNLWSFDGTTWTQLGDNPDYISGTLCVLNNTIYCVSDWAPLDSSYSNYGPALFKWSGSAWVKVLTISLSDYDTIKPGSCVVYNNYIYMMKQVTNSSTGALTTQLLRSNGNSFSTVSTVNYAVNINGNGVVLNNKIYWLGGYLSYDGSVDINSGVITSNGSSITLPSSNNTPFGSTDVDWYADVFDSIIHMLINTSTSGYKHYTFDGSTWTKLFDMSQTFEMYLCTYNTRLYAMGSNQFMYYSKTHDKYPEHTLILQIADTHDGPYETSLVNTSELVTNGRFVTKFNDVFFVGASGLETTDPIYYGDGSKWVKFKN